jgi:hypothetical protein
MTEAQIRERKIKEALSAAHTKKGRLQRACLELIQQHAADGAIPTNGRFLFYELEQAGVIPKQYLDANGRKLARQPAADISDALTHLREGGLVPWEWIIDELRHINDWEFASSVYARTSWRRRNTRASICGARSPRRC